MRKDAVTAIRVSPEILDRAERIAEAIPKRKGGHGATRSTIIMLCLEDGLRRLEERHGVRRKSKANAHA